MSLCNNHIINVTDARGAIYIGVWGTLRVQEQKFDISPWRDAYGDGQLLVLVQRRGDQIPYEAADVTVSESGIATWTFTEADTAIVGEGKAALVYIVGNERVARTEPYQTYVAPTIGISDDDPPDPWADWYTRVLAASAAAVAAMGGAETAQTAAEAAQTAAEAAQTASETAQGKAESAQTAAETAQTAAETAQTAAETAQTAAETAQTSAETAQGKAEAAQGRAETARSAAETAQGLAETAQTAAAASASDALASSQTAQAWAEGKRGDADVPSTDPAYHNNAKYWSEQAAQTLSSKYEKPANGIPTADIADGAVTTEKLSDDVNERIYAAYPSETQSGESILHTDIGADGIPVKAMSATVSATGAGTLTAKNYGVNLLERTTPVPSISVKRPNGIFEDKAGYRLYLPPGYYYLSIDLARSGSVMNVLVVGADGTDKTLSNFYKANGTHPSELDGAGGIVWYAAATTDPSARKVKIDEGDALVLFMNNTLLGGQINWTYVDNLQVERGADVYPYPVTTPMQEYITPIAATIDYDGDGTFDASNLPVSRYGINNWMYDLPLPSGVTAATLNVSYRCDPTLAYDKLKAAIVAAGTT